MTDQEALRALNAVPGLGPRRIRACCREAGGARRVFQCHELRLSCIEGIGTELAHRIRTFDCRRFLINENRLLKELSADVLTHDNAQYPRLLKEVPDPPPVIYIKGDPAVLDSLPGIAIVGSRRASFYGREVASRFSAELAECGFNVISGMARGIDAAAHESALRAGGITTAVLGSGLADIYPVENRRLFEQISGQGLVLSEFPLQTAPIPGHFSRRNRIVSGLALGVVVVEAASRSGALITARLAMEQGREVFAVPGRIDQSRSRGTHRLLREGACLVQEAGDILEELAVHLQRFRPPDEVLQKEKKEDFSDALSAAAPQQQRILTVLRDGPRHIDQLTAACEATLQNTISSVLCLECDGRIKRLPGNIFQLNPKSAKRTYG